VEVDVYFLRCGGKAATTKEKEGFSWLPQAEKPLRLEHPTPAV
jgi:hypothetical protein